MVSNVAKMYLRATILTYDISTVQYTYPSNLLVPSSGPNHYITFSPNLLILFHTQTFLDTRKQTIENRQ